MFNQDLFFIINNLAGHNVWLDKLAIFFAVYSGYILVAILLFLWLAKPSNRKMVAVALVIAGATRLVLTNIIRFFYPHPRPFDVMHVRQLITESSSSFPSGHASFFFALSTVVYLYNRKLGWWFFGVSLLMGIARVYAGVHWPADILGGFVLGILAVFFGKNILSKIKNPHLEGYLGRN